MMEKPMRNVVFVLVSFFSMNVAASTTLKCVGHGENLYMNGSQEYPQNDLIDRVPMKKEKIIYIVVGETEMDVDGTRYWNSDQTSDWFNSYHKSLSSVSGYKYIKFPGAEDELRQEIYIDRLTGEFESIIKWETSGDSSSLTYAEEEYGKGVDRIMKINGTCTLSSKVF